LLGHAAAGEGLAAAAAPVAAGPASAAAAVCLRPRQTVFIFARKFETLSKQVFFSRANSKIFRIKFSFRAIQNLSETSFFRAQIQKFSLKKIFSREN
jgi:hypothetical protein